jgi:hypothetical protein
MQLWSNISLNVVDLKLQTAEKIAIADKSGLAVAKLGLLSHKKASHASLGPTSACSYITENEP